MSEKETYQCMGVFCAEELPALGTCSKACDDTVVKPFFGGSYVE